MISKQKYCDLMGFTSEWRDRGLLPDYLLDQLVKTYQAGNEDSSEHDRNGVFHWWLKQSPEKHILKMLVQVSLLDPDQIMAEDVRSYIIKSAHADEEIRSMINQGMT